MPLFRKIFFAIFIVLAVGLGLWAYFSLKNSKKPKLEAITLLPDSCLLYVSTSDFFGLDKKLNSQSIIVDKLKLFKDIDQFCNTLRLFDSLFNSGSLIREEISNTPIHLAVYGKKLNWLAAFNLKQLGGQDRMIKEISKLLNAKMIEHNIYMFELNGQRKFYFSVNSGVVIISSAQTNIELALNSSGRKLYNNPSFTEFKNTLEDNKLLSIFINHELYQKSEASVKLKLPEICSKGFYAGVVDIQPSELKINGFLEPDSASILSVFEGQTPQKPDFVNSLPFTCNYFQACGFSSFAGLKKRLDQLQPGNSSTYWKMVNDSALYNLESAFYENARDYVVGFESGASRQKYVFINVSDTLIAKEHLKIMSDSLSRKNQDEIFRLRRSASNDNLKLLSPLSECVTKYAAIYHSVIYFSEKEEDLAQLLYNFRINMIITENASFNAYRNQNFPEKFNYLVYNIPSVDKTDRTSFFNFDANTKNDPFENFKHFSFSITNGKKQLEFRWHLLNETETINKTQNILWAVQLDTTSAMKAQGFVNHITKENELVVQDDSHKLYLINAKGTILWKLKLSEKITSQIFTVDVFKNNKYQILFSTKNQLHLIDRNGNYLPGYPLNLPAEASCPLSVFDYDNTRDYRLFIACKNNQIYNYALSGKRQEGFNTFRTDSKVRLAVKYVKVGLSDYLVALDEDGKIYTFSRKGDARIGLKNKTTANCVAFYIEATGNINTTHFIYADDKNSLICKISFADKKEIVKLNCDVENAGINFSQSANGKTSNIIFTKLNAVIVYDLNGNLISNRPFENDLSETDLYEDENRSVFLTRSHIRDELLVADPLKQKVKLFGATSLPLVSDLFNDNKKYMVITNGSRVNCVLLN